MSRQVLSLACLLAITISVSAEVETVRVDAAFNYDNVLFLFSGNEFVVLVDYRQHKAPHERSIFQLPDDFYLLAAYQEESTGNIHFYGPNSIATVNLKDLHQDGAITFQDYEGYPFKTGPDAVFSDRNDYKFFHKGCRVYAQDDKNAHLSTRYQMSNLPCDVDATWDDNGHLVALKGDQIWLTTMHDQSGPFNFHDAYHLEAWRLRPAC